jgi:N-acetylmuramic acid 6-phosphate etherase
LSVTYGVLDSRVTERRNPNSADIDRASPLELVDLMNAEDRTVAAAVATQREAIAQAIALVETAFRAGHRLFYVGAGTSGRLGVLDASECPPTFGSDPEMVQGIIAGGNAALTRSQEGAEDRPDGARQDLSAAGVKSGDVVVGIAASGTTPYVRAALELAKSRGAHTVIVACSPPAAEILKVSDIAIVPITGPEVLTGSTRLKAGTATKLVLNTITTGAMIRVGKAYGNLMVDLQATNEKLRDRAERLVMVTCAVDRDGARRAIEGAGGSVKLAIVMTKLGVARNVAAEKLHGAAGSIRRVVGSPPPVDAA